MNPTKTQKVTLQYVIIVLASSVVLLELVSFCSTGWMRLEGIDEPDSQQLTEDRTRNRRNYDRYSGSDSMVPSSHKPPLEQNSPNSRPNQQHMPNKPFRPTEKPNSDNSNTDNQNGPTERPPRPSKSPGRPVSGGQNQLTLRPKPNPASSTKYPPRPTRSPIRTRPTKPNPSISYPPRRTRGPLPNRTKNPSGNRTWPVKPNPNISYPPRPTRGPLPNRTPNRPRIRSTSLPSGTRITRPSLFTRRTYTSASRRPAVTRPPKYSQGPGQYLVPGQPDISGTPDRKPVTRVPLPWSTPKPNKQPQLPDAEMNFIANLIGQINTTWSKNTTAKFIKEKLISSGWISNPYGIDFSRIATILKRSNYNQDTMIKVLARFLALTNPGTNNGDLLPGKPRLPNNGNKPIDSDNANGGKGTGGVSDGLTDSEGLGNKVSIEIGLWTAVICRENLQTSVTECERSHDNFNGILHDRVAWSMVDVRVEAVFAITFGLIGSLCSVLMVNPWCLKQKHRLLLIGGICALTISGLMYFITIGRVVAIKGAFEQEAGKDYSHLKIDTPWCLYVGGLGAGLAFVTSGILATSKWVENRKDYSEFGDEVVFTKDGDKPVTEA